MADRAREREATLLAGLGLLLLLALMPWVFRMRPEGFLPFLRLSSWRFLGLGLAMTLGVSATALVGSLPAALGLALARRMGPAWLRLPATLAIEGIRAVPLIGLVFLMFLRLGSVGRSLKLEALGAPALALTVALLLYTAAVTRPAPTWTRRTTAAGWRATRRAGGCSTSSATPAASGCTPRPAGRRP